jgi:hypothetical protein
MTVFAIPTEKLMLVEGPPQGQWTLADWENLPDSWPKYRYEVIDGVLYVSDDSTYCL